MHRRLGLSFASALVLGFALSLPGSAACPPTEAWPPFADIAADARRVVVGTVIEAADGAATRLRVEEILRGDSRRVLHLDMLRSRLAQDPATCAHNGHVHLEVGDRAAIAFSGRHDGQRGLDSVALLDSDDSHANRGDLERYTTAQVRLLLGHEANGSTVAAPSRAKPPLDLFEALRQALLSDVLDFADALGLGGDAD